MCVTFKQNLIDTANANHSQNLRLWVMCHHCNAMILAPVQQPGLTQPSQLMTIQSNPIRRCYAMIQSDAFVMQLHVSLGQAHNKESAMNPIRSKNLIHPKDVTLQWNNWDAKIFNPVGVKWWNSFKLSIIWLLQQPFWLSNSIRIDLWAHVKHQTHHFSYLLVLPASTMTEWALCCLGCWGLLQVSAGCYAVAFCQGVLSIVSCFLSQVSLQY